MPIVKAWAESTGHQYLGTLEENGVLMHYLRKASEEEAAEKKHSAVITNEELQEKLVSGEELVLLDVREAAEFAFQHIPEAKPFPLGELERRMEELPKEQKIYVICRTGTRSDLAAQKLAQNGFDAINVVPGMSEWTGETAGIL